MLSKLAKSAEALRKMRNAPPGTKKRLDESEATLLASGGYNDIWIVNQDDGHDQSLPLQFILRVPNDDDSLKPYQIRNEVAFLKFINGQHKRIPVPQVYAWQEGNETKDDGFIAMEFIHGQPLSEAWASYSDEDKEKVVRDVAELMVDLCETHFDGIGGLEQKGSQFVLGPTIEGHKLFKGRYKFHNHHCYNIGPYSSVREYVISCYDKEIYYHSHGGADIKLELFAKTSLLDDTSLVDEPFVLHHSDLNGRNIIMNGTHIAAVIDWEFAAFYPLSQLFPEVEVLEMTNDDAVEECFAWRTKSCEYVEEVARARGWSEGLVSLLMSEPYWDELAHARCEMMPHD